MKKQLIISTSLALFIALPALAHENRASSTAPRLEQHQEMQDQMENRREELKKDLEAKREQMKDRMEQHHQELKDKLKTFRDQRKAQIAERVQNNLTALNERMITHFTNVLDRLEKILERIVSRTDKTEKNGRDVSAVRLAISKAETAIAAARGAVETQTGKTYPVEVGDESTVRADVSAARQALHKDLKTVHEAIVAAREAVHKAATSLGKIPKVDENPSKNATSTISE